MTVSRPSTPTRPARKVSTLFGMRPTELVQGSPGPSVLPTYERRGRISQPAGTVVGTSRA